MNDAALLGGIQHVRIGVVFQEHVHETGGREETGLAGGGSREVSAQQATVSGTRQHQIRVHGVVFCAKYVSSM